MLAGQQESGIWPKYETLLGHYKKVACYYELAGSAVQMSAGQEKSWMELMSETTTRVAWSYELAGSAAEMSGGQEESWIELKSEMIWVTPRGLNELAGSAAQTSTVTLYEPIDAFV